MHTSSPLYSSLPPTSFLFPPTSHLPPSCHITSFYIIPQTPLLHNSNPPQTPIGPGVRSTPRQHALFCQQQLHLWVGWLFTVLVVPMLRTCFYITESEHYRTHIFYYRYDDDVRVIIRLLHVHLYQHAPYWSTQWSTQWSTCTILVNIMKIKKKK